jgi:hypothetical protein
VIISAIQKQDASSSRYGHLVDDIRVVMSSFPLWQIGHVGRDSNHVAHSLAKAAIKNVSNRKWDHSIPECISDIVLDIGAFCSRLSFFINENSIYFLKKKKRNLYWPK